MTQTMKASARECKNVHELYMIGFQSILLCRDCWQTNYLHENDVAQHEIVCMCGNRHCVWMETYKVDFVETPFLWFKTRQHRGQSSLIQSRLLSLAPSPTTA